MMNTVRQLIGVAALVSAGMWAWGQAPSDGPCPMHAEHMKGDAHHAIVDSHGDQAMGFAHDKTTHHFLMSETGGSIQVTANDAKDEANIDAIRMHLAHITKMFTDGDFSTPMFVHDSLPPGVTTMKLLNEKIHYAYEPIDGGGRVSITTGDAVAQAAVHDFLRFQITEHRTGDPVGPDAAK